MTQTAVAPGILPPATLAHPCAAQCAESIAVLPEAEGWCAELELCFARSESRTVLATRRHRGPLRIQRAFYPEPGGVCHAYLLHPPGGVVAGDRLAINVELDEGAQVLLTTPAAGKFYRSAGRTARRSKH